MLEVRQTVTFQRWWSRLKDERGRGVIFGQIDKLAHGHGGDIKPVGDGVNELRIHHGPGYRVYFQRRDKTIIILLCGGDKTTQARDIKAAQRLAKEWSP